YGQAEAYAEDDQPAAYAEDGQYDAYAEDGYAETGQPEDGYAAEEPTLDFDLEVYDLPADDAPEPASSPHYGDALASVATGAAASRFDSGFSARPFETGASQWTPELTRTRDRFAERPQAAAEPEPFSPHRDPVVR